MKLRDLNNTYITIILNYTNQPTLKIVSQKQPDPDQLTDQIRVPEIPVNKQNQPIAPGSTTKLPRIVAESTNSSWDHRKIVLES